VKPLDFPLLADENIHPDVISYLRQQECDIRSVAEDEPFIGIIYLRPGHIRAEFTIQTLRTIDAQPLDVQSSFVLVAEQRDQTVHIGARLL
jgi:hypothetical protein